MMPVNGEWMVWSKHVLAELERLSKCYENLQKDITDISVQIAMLKVKSGLWGAAAGFVPAAIAVAYLLLKG